MIMLPALANIPMPVAKFMHLLGEYMIEDDRDDIFKTVYYNDQYHYYHGEKHPDHPSFMHHWMLGGVFCFTGQMLGAMNIAREVMYIQQQHDPQLDLDNVPLPGGKRIIQVPYREIKPQPMLEDKYQRMRRKIDSIAKL